MTDPRYDRLASILVTYSVHLQPEENLLIEASAAPDEFVVAVMRAAVSAGGRPILNILRPRLQREFIRSCTEEQIEFYADVEKYKYEKLRAYISIRGAQNVNEYADVPPEKMRIYERKFVKPVHFDVRVKRTKWVALRWPTPSMAQMAGMSTEAFEEFYFRVCTLDYAELAVRVEPLRELMARTKRVHIVGPGTDLRLSIDAMPIIPCVGRQNIPDGEVFSAPLRESVCGRITFNTKTVQRGITFENVSLAFDNGRIVEATASGTEQTRKLTEILDADEGARYAGEFSLGVNPHITQPMGDTLFDEKIAGSIHLTPGNAYDEADNGNRSDIHWDMVLLQDAAHGGGRIYFDDELVRQDGVFVPPELIPLNPAEMLARAP